MTEIKIEKKKPMWPWLVLGIVVIGLLLYLFAYNRNDAVVSLNSQDTLMVPSEVSSYIQFINNDQDTMSLSHEFSHEALIRLIEAITVTADNNNFDIKADLESARGYASDITKDQYDTSHADKIRAAADILTSALVNLQKKEFPDLTNEVDELEIAAGSISPDTLTLDQKSEVRNFFDKAKNLLQKMNN